MSISTSPGIASLLADLLERRDLSAEQMTFVLEGMFRGECGEAEMAAFLVALRAKGESAGELAAAATVMRRHARPFPLGRTDILDTCGTGGDGSGTFNISTATALVVAGAGVQVVKHGNRGISSASGSADVLTHLGVGLTADPGIARRCLDEAGMAFCFAPNYHPALRHVGEVRRRLGIRTLFNCLGPLANPAGAAYQLLGVGRPEWLNPMAGALSRLGPRRAVLVQGCDGLDEVTLAGPTLVRLVEGSAVTELEWTPADFGLPVSAVDSLRVDGPAGSAAVIRGVLDGRGGLATDIVLANASAALFAAGRVDSPGKGMTLARQSIASGKAAAVLAGLIRITSGPPRAEGHSEQAARS